MLRNREIIKYLEYSYVLEKFVAFFKMYFQRILNARETSYVIILGETNKILYRVWAWFYKKIICIYIYLGNNIENKYIKLRALLLGGKGQGESKYDLI